MSKDGFARAAQALAPGVARSFIKIDRIHDCDIRFFTIFSNFCLAIVLKKGYHSVINQVPPSIGGTVTS
jgi:hypothetical protein